MILVTIWSYFSEFYASVASKHEEAGEGSSKATILSILSYMKVISIDTISQDPGCESYVEWTLETADENSWVW